MSQSGLGGRGGLEVCEDGWASDRTGGGSNDKAEEAVEAVGSAWDLRAWNCEDATCVEESGVVALFLNGLSNAFFRFLTLTCPNPGRLRSWSGVAFAMPEKLPKDERRVSTSVLLTLLMEVRALRRMDE